MTWLGTFLVALLACLAVMFAMALGVLFGRDPLRGSCDGACLDCGRRTCRPVVARGRSTEEPA